jgi:hypothetical protein
MHDQEPWCPADLFFLRDVLLRGMPPEEAAGFLGKSVSEVTAKAKALWISITKQQARVGSPRNF